MHAGNSDSFRLASLAQETNHHDQDGSLFQDTTSDLDPSCLTSRLKLKPCENEPRRLDARNLSH
jgi:hypothetical protein